MVRANKRNEALRIESALLNKIAMLGTEKTAEAVGVDKSQISRWKRDWIPKVSMLLARSIDERTQISFVKVARTELLKAEARALLPSLPKEDGYTFIPNAFLEKLLKEDISVSQFNDVLKVFRQGR